MRDELDETLRLEKNPKRVRLEILFYARNRPPISVFIWL